MYQHFEEEKNIAYVNQISRMNGRCLWEAINQNWC